MADALARFLFMARPLHFLSNRPYKPYKNLYHRFSEYATKCTDKYTKHI